MRSRRREAGGRAGARGVDLAADAPAPAPHTVVAEDVVSAGNTSAVQVPLAIDRLLSEGSVAGGGPALLVGFGAGLTHAAQVVALP